MKKWYSLTCCVCGFRFPLQKFRPAMKPILYPVQLVTGGGRAKGFKVAEYLPWSALPTLKQAPVWNSLLYLYARLADGYDHFYQELGFLSPEMQKLIQQLQRSYEDAYRTNPLSEYTETYAPKLTNDIVEPYNKANYPTAYAHLITNPTSGGTLNG